MKKIILVILLLILTKSYTQIDGDIEIIDHTFISGELELDTLKYTYKIDTLKGKFHGNLKVWNEYKNLIIKGRYIKNQKKGKWNYFDVEGNKISSRKYYNSFQYKARKQKQKIPWKDSLIRNNQNFIEYANVPDSCNLKWSNYYRYISKDSNNKSIFKNDTLWKKIKNFIQTTPQKKIYNNADFRIELEKDETMKLIESYSESIIGYNVGFPILGHLKIRQIIII